MRARILALVVAIAMVVGAIVVRNRIDHPSKKHASTAAGPTTTTVVALPRSPLVLVAWKDTADTVLTPACGGAIPWKCIGDAVRANKFRLGAPDLSEPSGLPAVAALAGGRIGNAHYASNDFDDPDVATWILDVARSTAAVRRNGVRSVDDLLVLRKAVADGFIATEADAAVVASAASRSQIAVICPKPTAIVGTVAGAPASPACGQLGKDDGLPSPGVLDALEGLVTS